LTRAEVVPRRRTPLPCAITPAAPRRDTLGLVRLLYAADDETRRSSLAQAGQQPSRALEMSEKPPGTLGFGRSR
jgi:hypothetical protein